jgi:Asp-tRNA(Asn)/Glu-tRNA(Gln) amidotransferase C subunit
MTLVETVKAHSVESIEEMIDKFDLDEELIPDVSYNSPKARQQVFQNVLEDADGYFNYRYNKKFDLHQIEKLQIKGE